MSKRPVFLCGENRKALYPIVHEDIFEEYKIQFANLWIADEIDFSNDREQFEKLPKDEQHLLKVVLSFFAGADTIVSLNVIENFCKEIHVLEAQICYTFQAMMENIHSEAYSMMIDAFISDPIEKERLFLNIEALDSVNQKIQFAEKFRNLKQRDDEDFGSLAKRLLAFIIVEGLFFSSSFAIIFWYKQKNILDALTKSNTFIARDEGRHVLFGALIYSKLPELRLSDDECTEIFREAVSIEKKYVEEMLTTKHVGMNQELMCQYVEYVADTLRVMLDYPVMYGAMNPFTFMDMLGMDGRDNFFESVPTQYRKSAIFNEGKDLADLVEDF